ncbi:ABC transporter permease, partial [Streptomyces griseus]|nr:ABC transporter permease [Streptomyces griseus]
MRPGDPARPRNPLWTLGLLRSEITTLLRRHRTYARLGVLAAVPVLI